MKYLKTLQHKGLRYFLVAYWGYKVNNQWVACITAFSLFHTEARRNAVAKSARNG